MPKNLSLYKSLQKKYGKKAKEIYYSMENSGNPATKPKAIAKSKKDHPVRYKKEKGAAVKKIVKLVKSKKGNSTSKTKK